MEYVAGLFQTQARAQSLTAAAAVVPDPLDAESLPDSLSEEGTSLSDWLRSDFPISPVAGSIPVASETFS